MQRNKRSAWNAIFAVAQTTCTGLLGFVFVKFILTYFGSDFNGLNSTASQLVTILMLLEGGFTVATNVAMFRPYFAKDYDKVNAIISATRLTFRRIGITAFAVGVVICLCYSLVINTSLPRILAFFVFLMTILPVCFNFYYATKYRILLQAEQKEYVISAFTLLTSSLGYITNIIAMPLGCSMWFVRFVTMLFSLLNSLLIAIYVRRHFPEIRYDAEPDFEAIKGTKDVFAQKLTGVFYSTAPMVCITLTAGGTMLASVYSIYNSVFVLLKSVLSSVIDAPRLSLGELASQGNRSAVWRVFDQYELIIEVLLLAFLSTASVIIMPFVTLYTAGVTDINYHQPIIAIMLVLITVLELLHIPSGHLMNMTGQFRISRNFQIIATGIMLVGFTLSLLCRWSVLGVLATVLLTASSLCVMEISYIHTRYFSHKLFAFLRSVIPFGLMGVALVMIEQRFLPAVSDYLRFFLLAAVLFTANFAVATGLAFVCKPTCAKGVLQRAKRLHPRRG